MIDDSSFDEADILNHNELSFLKTIDKLNKLDNENEIVQYFIDYIKHQTRCDDLLYYKILNNELTLTKNNFNSISLNTKLIKQDIDFFNKRNYQLNRLNLDSLSLPNELEIFLKKSSIKTIYILTLLKEKNYRSGVFIFFEENICIDSKRSFNILILTRFVESALKRSRIKMELISSLKNSENALKIKNEFLNNMSHEIRTPLNSLIGFTSLLEKKVIDIDTKGYLDSIKTSGHNLLSLINDILDMSKLDLGKIEIEKNKVSVNNFFNSIYKFFSYKLNEKNLQFSIEIDPSIPDILFLDEKRLRQVLINVVGNAIKFTDEGYVRINIYNRYPELQKPKIDLVISIEDSGIGIAKDQIEKIFIAFEQQEGQSNKYGGTGLGLAITKKLVDLMNGEILIDSIPDKGTYFNIVLPGIEIVNREKNFISDLKTDTLAKDHKALTEEKNNTKDFSDVDPQSIKEIYQLLKENEKAWEAISKSLIINEIEEFILELKTKVSPYNSKVLSQWFFKIDEELAIFNIHRVIELFRQYPILLKKLKGKMNKKE